MNTLFDSKLDRLKEFSNFRYNYKSHTFNNCVISSYNDLLKYDFKFTDDYIIVNQIKKTSVFLLNKEFDISGITFKKKPVIYSEFQIANSKKIYEIYYNLDELFANQDKQIRRGIRLVENKDIVIRDIQENDMEMIDALFEKWKLFKQNNPKVFQITFSPKRYRLSYNLKDIGFNVYQKLILVCDKIYGAINFSINTQTKSAYELSFLSLYFDKEIKVTNDFNDNIMISCLYDLWKNYDIKTVNTGQTAGIKGLSFFKKKIQNNQLIVYTKTL